MKPEEKALSGEERALAALRWARTEIERLKNQAREPIAIIGFAYRLPGGDSLWDTLNAGADTSSEVPADRWNAAQYYDPRPGTRFKSVTRRASFVPSIGDFDAAFFDISSAEAEAMDPQQRTSLECAYAALEHAGQSLDAVRATKSGVFMGVTSYEHLARVFSPTSAGENPYVLTGVLPAILAGRIAYELGLMGPALVVDTACSSSLVALHLACESLRAHTSNLALAGGVSVMISATASVALSQVGALSADGRCKTFDASADGYGRGEGCGVAVLKRLSDAERDGDRVWAVVRGSAVNQDGRSDGMTAPNGEAQRRVLKDALQAASLTPKDVQYVEAHGTGTILGDPIEVDALAEVYGEGRATDQPLLVGSVKSVLGHLEGAAGISGLLKMVLSIHHRQLPASLHFKQPNPHIPWNDIPVRVQNQRGAWPLPDRPLVAGVSSFGLSGTNAHVIVSEPPAATAGRVEDAASVRLLPLTLSARSEDALCTVAARTAAWLASPPEPFGWTDVAFTANVRRTALERRLVVVGSSARQWSERLAAFARGDATPDVVTGTASEVEQRPVFVFSGQGPQWWGMGRELLAEEPVFRATLDACARAIQTHVSWSLIDELTRDEGESQLQRTDIAQPAIVALQLALAGLYRSWGVTPRAVIGHSVGEISAAAVAGVLTLEQACALACLRGKIMHKAGGGRMAAAATDGATAEEVVRAHEGKLAVGAYNAPTSVVLTGDPGALQLALEELGRRGVHTRDLRVAYAFHAPQMDPLRDGLVAALRGIEPSSPSVRIVSTLTGEEGARFDAAYWGDQMRSPVRFERAVGQLVTDGCDLFLEVGPHPVLAPAIDETAAARSRRVRIVSTLRRNQDQRLCALEAAGALHVHGCSVTWAHVVAQRGRIVDLPGYPWERQRYELDVPAQGLTPVTSGAWPLSGAPLDVPGSALHQVLPLSVRQQPYLADHVVHGRVVVPGAFYLSVMLAIAVDRFHALQVTLSSVEFIRPLFLEGEMALHTVLEPAGDGYAFTLSTRDPQSGDWRVHAQGTLQVDATAAPGDTAALGEWRRRLTDSVAADDLLALISRTHIQWGAQWMRVDQIFSGAQSAQSAQEGLVRLAGQGDARTGPIPPVFIDNSFLSPFVAGLASGGDAEPFLPWALGALRWFKPVEGAMWAHAQVHSRSEETVVSNLTFTDDGGAVVARIEDFTAKRAGREAFLSVPGDRPHDHQDKLDEAIFEVAWRTSKRAPAGPPSGPWLILEGAAPQGAGLAKALEARGARVVRAVLGAGFTRHGTTGYTVDLLEPSLVRRLLHELEADAAPAHIVSVLGLELRSADTPLDERALRRAEELHGNVNLAIVQALAQVGWSEVPRLFLVTRGCQPARGSEDVTCPEQALAWGFAATVMHEMPKLGTTLIDVDPGTSAETLAEELLGADDENRIALRGTDRLVPRLVRRGSPQQNDGAGRPLQVTTSEGPAAAAPESGGGGGSVVRPDVTYLITGGLGGLGLVVAGQLVRMGARHLALLGRSPPSAPAKVRIDALEQDGAAVSLLQADVADRPALRAALEALARHAPPVKGLVHAAGFLDDATLLSLTPARYHAVLAPKVMGAVWLDALLPDLDFRVYFAGAAGLLGSGGQANYAAANAFLDAHAHSVHAHGSRALSLDWGAWGQVGLAASAHRADNLVRQGLAVLSPEDGAELFSRALASAGAQLALIPIAFAQWRQANPHLATLPLLRELVTPSGPRAAARSSSLQARLRAMSTAGERIGALEEHIRGAVASTLRLAPDAVARSVAFKQLGFDSLMTVGLKNTLERDLAVPLSAATLFTYPSISALAAFLAGKLAPAAAPAAQEARQPPRPSSRPPAGESGASPGEAPSLDATLALLEEEGYL